MNLKGLQEKIKEWTHRYGYAEIMGILAAYLGYFIALVFLKDFPLLAAYVSSICESLGYYSIILIREFSKTNTTRQDSVLKTLFHLFTEFGPSELLDTFILRPLAIDFSVAYFGVSFGVLVGKIWGDVAFYIPVILSYELRQHFYRKKEKYQII